MTAEKVQKVVKTCQNLLSSHFTTLVELTRVMGLLSSTIEAMEPVKIQLTFLQLQQIVCLRENMNYQSVVTLNIKSRTELTWWVDLRFIMTKLFLSWTHIWLFKQMLPWQYGEQPATVLKHHGNGQRRREPCT